jgi:hypothetical protein
MLLLSIAANVRKGQRHDRQRWRGRKLLSTGFFGHTSSVADHCKCSDRTSDVLKFLLAQIGEPNRDLASNLIVGRRRDADATRFGDALKPCGDVDAVAKDVMRLNNYVADIDAHTESKTPVFHITDCKFMNAGLEQHRGPNRLDKSAVSEAPIAVDKPAESKDLTDRAKYVDELAVENSKLDAKMKPFAEDVEALGSLRFLRRGRTRFDVDPGFEAQ